MTCSLKENLANYNSKKFIVTENADFFDRNLQIKFLINIF